MLFWRALTSVSPVCSLKLFFLCMCYLSPPQRPHHQVKHKQFQFLGIPYPTAVHWSVLCIQKPSLVRCFYLRLGRGREGEGGGLKK